MSCTPLEHQQDGNFGKKHPLISEAVATTESKFWCLLVCDFLQGPRELVSEPNSSHKLTYLNSIVGFILVFHRH